MFEPGVNFNRYGDLCWKCRELNSTEIEHSDGSKTNIFVDKVFKQGPSNMNRFYMNNAGKPQNGTPLFGEMGVSTVDLDSISALKYPLLDWTGCHLDHDLGPKFFRWPHECYLTTIPYSKSGWPPLDLRKKVLLGGCHLVPRSPKI